MIINLVQKYSEPGRRNAALQKYTNHDEFTKQDEFNLSSFLSQELIRDVFYTPYESFSDFGADLIFPILAPQILSIAEQLGVLCAWVFGIYGVHNISYYGDSSVARETSKHFMNDELQDNRWAQQLDALDKFPGSPKSPSQRSHSVGMTPDQIKLIRDIAAKAKNARWSINVASVFYTIAVLASGLTKLSLLLAVASTVGCLIATAEKHRVRQKAYGKWLNGLTYAQGKFEDAKEYGYAFKESMSKKMEGAADYAAKCSVSLKGRCQAASAWVQQQYDQASAKFSAGNPQDPEHYSSTSYCEDYDPPPKKGLLGRMGEWVPSMPSMPSLPSLPSLPSMSLINGLFIRNSAQNQTKQDTYHASYGAPEETGAETKGANDGRSRTARSLLPGSKFFDPGSLRPSSASSDPYPTEGAQLDGTLSEGFSSGSSSRAGHFRDNPRGRDARRHTSERFSSPALDSQHYRGSPGFKG